MSKNITYAAFAGPGRKATAMPSLYQWDYGQVLKISGLELPDAYQVHFSNTSTIGTAKTVIGNADGVQVPDEYLRTGQPVYAWLFLHAGEEDGETVFSITIPVQKRPEPTDETPTPVEQSEISQAIAALQTATEKTAKAQGKAEEAQGAAETAQKAAEDAQDSAEEAAKAAGESETAAGEKATEAASEATLAKSYAVGSTGTRDGEDTDNAKYYKERTEQIKTDALREIGEAVENGIEAVDGDGDSSAKSRAVAAVENAAVDALRAVGDAESIATAAVTNEGNAQVERVQSAGTTQVTAVNQAGASQVGNVNTAGEAQVNAVNQAGTTQVAAVKSEGEKQTAAAASEAEKSEGSAEDAEAWAVGQRNGVDVDSSDPAYHNNAKWISEHIYVTLGVDDIPSATSENPMMNKALMLGNQETKAWHLGLYLDEGGDLSYD